MKSITVFLAVTALLGFSCVEFVCAGKFALYNAANIAPATKNLGNWGQKRKIEAVGIAASLLDGIFKGMTPTQLQGLTVWYIGGEGGNAVGPFLSAGVLAQYGISSRITEVKSTAAKRPAYQFIQDFIKEVNNSNPNNTVMKGKVSMLDLDDETEADKTLKGAVIVVDCISGTGYDSDVKLQNNDQIIKAMKYLHSAMYYENGTINKLVTIDLLTGYGVSTGYAHFEAAKEYFEALKTALGPGEGSLENRKYTKALMTVHMHAFKECLEVHPEEWALTKNYLVRAEGFVPQPSAKQINIENFKYQYVEVKNPSAYADDNKVDDAMFIELFNKTNLVVPDIKERTEAD